MRAKKNAKLFPSPDVGGARANKKLRKTHAKVAMAMAMAIEIAIAIAIRTSDVRGARDRDQSFRCWNATFELSICKNGGFGVGTDGSGSG